jgi:hypothetical protein
VLREFDLRGGARAERKIERNCARGGRALINGEDMRAHARTKGRGGAEVN